MIVVIPSWDSAGTTIPLEAGQYRVSFAGIADGGQFDAWNPTGTVSGCDTTGANCTNGWLLSVGVDLGAPSGLFDRVVGNQYIQSRADGNTHIYSTAAAAQAQIQGAALLSAWLIEAGDPSSYRPSGNPFSFTLGQTQAVNFFIRDDSYDNNSGGVSLRLERLIGTTPPVPEPTTWAMMLAGFGLAGAAMRTRGRSAGFAAQRPATIDRDSQ